MIVSLLIRVLNGRDRARHYLQVMDKSRLFMTNNGLRRLPVLWTKTVQRDVLIFALDVYVDVVLTRTPLLYEARRTRVFLGGGGRRRS